MDDDVLFRLFELTIEQGLNDLTESGPATVSINTIGLFRVVGYYPEHIIEDFDSPLPHLQPEYAGMEIFSPEEQERRRADVLVDPEVTIERVANGDGAAGTSGFLHIAARFAVGDEVKELSRDAGVGFASDFRLRKNMREYAAVRLAVRTRDLERVSLSLGNSTKKTQVGVDIQIPREGEWIEVELPFYGFHYNERAGFSEEILDAFLQDIDRVHFGFDVRDTKQWRAQHGPDEGQNTETFAGIYNVQLDIDNIELIGEMPSFDEFVSQMKQYRERGPEKK